MLSFSMFFETTNRRVSKLVLAGTLILSVFSEAGWAKHTCSNGKIANDKYAYINKRGQIVFRISSEAESENFSDGLLKVKRETKNDEPDSSYIDTEGKLVADGFVRGGKFSEGFAEIGKYGKIGFIDKTGRVAIPQIFSDALCFREGLAPVMMNKGFGFIDRTGKIVIDPFFENATGFSEGLAAVQSQGKIGFIDKAGKWRIKPQFDYVDGFSDKLALVRDVQDEFYIDQDGRKVITVSEESKKRPFEPWGVSGTGLSTGKSIFQGFSYRTYCSPCTFKEGLSPMYKDRKYGYINKSGEFVIPPKFQMAYPFVEGLANVCIDNKYGFIDKSGRFVVKPKFRKAEDFSEGVAAVAIAHNKWGFIDAAGKFAVKPKYMIVGPFHDGRARVQLNGFYDDQIR